MTTLVSKMKGEVMSFVNSQVLFFQPEFFFFQP